MRSETFNMFRRVMHDGMIYSRSKLEIMGLYRGQPKLIKILSEEDGLTKKELAERFDVTAPTITKMVERLEKNEFVFTKKDDKDKRITRVFLSEKGKAIKDQLSDFMEEAVDVYFDGMTDQDVETLHRLLEKVSDNIRSQVDCSACGKK